MTVPVPAGGARLRVGLDSRNLMLSEGTGVATYGRTLLESIARMGGDAELVLDIPGTPLRGGTVRLRRYLRALGWRSRIVALHPNEVAARPAARLLARFARVHAARDVFRTANVHLDIYRRLLVLIAGDPPPLMHWTYPLPLRLRGALNLYTGHDLIPLRDPALTSIDQGKFRRLIRAIVKRADHIVTVSESSRRDIIELLGCRPERVTNTYQALDLPPALLARSDADVAAEVAATLGLPRGGYVLFAGSIEPRKNIRTLIEAHRLSGVALPLVLGGPDGWRAAEQLAAAGDRLRRAPCDTAETRAGAVVRLPYLPYERLLALVRGARALVFASLSEGFGLPILEAMALGTPVVAANFGAMAEIAGDAALLVDVRDPRALSQAIARIADDSALCAELAARGRRRAAQFSLDAYAARMERLYRGLLGGPR